VGGDYFERHEPPPGLEALAVGVQTVAEDEDRRARLLARVAALAALLLSATGIYWYVARPGVVSYTVGGWLVLPGYGVVLSRLHQRVPDRIEWLLAVALAIGGACAYLAWPSADWWYFGLLLLLPLAALIGLSIARSGAEPEPWFGGFQDGPWGPP